MRRVVITMGRVRSIDVFRRSLENQFKARIDGSIDDIVVLCDQNSLSHDLIGMVHRVDGEVVELPTMSDEELREIDPNIANRFDPVRSASGGARRGTLWRQLRDVANAVKLVDETDVIVRTRADVIIRAQDYAAAATRRQFQDRGPFGFQAKIWAQWASISNPFYIHDTAFAASAGDLRRLVNSGNFTRLAKSYPTANLPVFFWISPFLLESPAVDSWFTSRSGESFRHKDLHDQDFREALSFYFEVLHSLFDLDGVPIEWNLQWNGERTVKRNWDRARTRRNLEHAIDREFVWRGQGIRRRRHPAVNAIDSSTTLTRLLESEGDYPDLRRGYR